MEKSAIPKTTPALVIPYGEGNKFQAFYDISQPNNTTYCRESIPELKGKSYYQKNSHQGWLIVLCYDEDFDYTPWKYGDCFLWNPSSMETLKLPSLLHWYSVNPNRYWFSDCVLSSPPKSITGTKNEDSIVFVLFGGQKNGGIFLFCHPGDEKWRHYVISRDDFYDKGVGLYGLGDVEYICYFRGKFHVMWSRGGDHYEIEMQHGSEPEVLDVRMIETSCDILYESAGGILGSDHLITHFLETSDGTIFQICIRGRFPEYRVTSMVISKLDMSSKTWMKVTSLDDHVFFLNKYSQLSCSAKELGLTRGCVYFTQPNEMTFYMYDLEDDSITLSMPCPDIQLPWFSPNWLMIPTTLWTGEKRRVKGNKGDGSQVLRSMLSIISLENRDVEARLEVIEDDMVRLISNYLNPLDYLHFRAACKLFRSIIPLVNRRSSCPTKCLQDTNLSPWLVYPKDKGAIYSFINPMHNNENYLMSIPEMLQGSTIQYSNGSWLLMSKGLASVFFYNPFTKAIIKLPDLSDRWYYQYEGIAFSSLPTSSDCVVFAIMDYLDNRVRIGFIKRGDREWTFDVYKSVYLPPNGTFKQSNNSPIFYNGAFYCLNRKTILGVCTFENGIKWEVLSILPPSDCGYIYESYLVEFDGKLLSVLLGKYGEWVRVFTLDLAEKVWVEVKHLGRHTLFISNTSCVAKIATTSGMENKIYFPRLKNEQLLYYSLDSGRYHTLESEHSGTDYCNSKHNLWCSWIEPNWSETTQPNYDWS